MMDLRRTGRRPHKDILSTTGPQTSTKPSSASSLLHNFPPHKTSPSPSGGEDFELLPIRSKNPANLSDLLTKPLAITDTIPKPQAETFAEQALALDPRRRLKTLNSSSEETSPPDKPSRYPAKKSQKRPEQNLPIGELVKARTQNMAISLNNEKAYSWRSIPSKRARSSILPM